MTKAEPALGSVEVERLYHSVASDRLTDQLDVAETHQQRTTALMTIGSIVLPLTAGVLNSDSVDLESDTGQAVALTLAVVSYVGLVVCFSLASRLSKWDTRPDPNQCEAIMMPERTEPELLNWLGTARIRAFNTNESQLQRKAVWSARGALFLTAEVFCLSVAVLLPLVSRLR